MSQYKLPVGEVIENGIDFLVEHLSFITKASAKVVETLLGAMESGLLLVPIPVFIVLVGIGVWFLTKERKLTIGSALGLALIWNMGLWTATISTIALVLVATLCAIAIGVPLGICAAISKGTYRTVMPILDVMQTMPAFVYLIPAIPFFGLGKTAAIFQRSSFPCPRRYASPALASARFRRSLWNAPPHSARRACSGCSSWTCPWLRRPSWPASTRRSCWPCPWSSSRP